MNCLQLLHLINCITLKSAPSLVKWLKAVSFSTLMSAWTFYVSVALDSPPLLKLALQTWVISPPSVMKQLYHSLLCVEKGRLLKALHEVRPEGHIT